MPDLFDDAAWWIDASTEGATPMSSTSYCYPSTNFEGFRLSVLDDLGRPEAGNTNLYVSTQGIEADVKWTTEDGITYSQRLGNGAWCVNDKGATVPVGAEVTIPVCPWEFGLMSLLTGGPTALDNDDRIIGCAIPSPSVIRDRNVCLEIWTLAGSPNERGAYPDTGGGQAALFHHIFPSASAVMDDVKWDNNVDPMGFVFTCTDNPNIGGGPYGDWPDFNNGDPSQPYAPQGVYAGFIDVNPPINLCGPQVLTPGS